MRKRMLVLGLVSCLMISACLTGCGNKVDSTTTTATSEATIEKTTEISTEPLVEVDDEKLSTDTDANDTLTDGNDMSYMKEDFLQDWENAIKAQGTFAITESVYTQKNEDAEAILDKSYIYKFDTEKNIEILNYEGIVQANDWDNDTHCMAVVDEAATELANKPATEETTEKEATTEEQKENTTEQATEATTEKTTEQATEATTEETEQVTEETEQVTEETEQVTVYKWVKNEDMAYKVGYEDCVKDIYEQTMQIKKGAKYYNYDNNMYYFTATTENDEGITISVMIITDTDFVPLHIIKEELLPTGQTTQRIINFEYGIEVAMPEVDTVVVN